MAPAYLIIVWALTTLVAAFVGSYFAGYLKKKGENLATHEDIKTLVEQVEAVTAATKKIEADISTGVWDRQKRWDMKREVLFGAVKRLANLDDALLSYASATRLYQAKQQAWETTPPSDAERQSSMQPLLDSGMHLTDCISAFNESCLFIDMVCSQAATEAFRGLGQSMSRLADQMKDAPQTYQTARLGLIKEILEARNTIRKELEVGSP